MKISEILAMLKDDGWYLVATKGSHRQFKHPSKPSRVTVPGKPSDEIALGTKLGTKNSIFKQASWK
jgi:predicted RNA binding protein YcfA (HicA-like mRNA interferase family)